MTIQSNLGSTIAMAFDECVENPAEYKYAKQSCERTVRWLERCKRKMDELNSKPGTINPHLERCQFEYGNEEDVDFDEPFPEDDDEYLQERQEQNPAYAAEEHFDRDEGREEAACLGTVGFSHQHQHRRIECGTEIHEAVGIGGSRDI